jgi:hypothetical protein
MVDNKNDNFQLEKKEEESIIDISKMKFNENQDSKKNNNNSHPEKKSVEPVRDIRELKFTFDENNNDEKDKGDN